MMTTNVHRSIWVYLQSIIADCLARLWVHVFLCGCVRSVVALALASAWVGVIELMLT